MLAKIVKCTNCGEEYNHRRKELGYDTCLGCGDRSARRISTHRTQENLREMAPYSFTGGVDDLFDKREE